MSCTYYKHKDSVSYVENFKDSHCRHICNNTFDVLLTVHFSIFVSVINQLGAQNFCFTISLFHASTCFEHMCSSSGDQNCITQHLVQNFCASSCLIAETNICNCSITNNISYNSVPTL